VSRKYHEQNVISNEVRNLGVQPQLEDLSSGRDDSLLRDTILAGCGKTPEGLEEVLRITWLDAGKSGMHGFAALRPAPMALITVAAPVTTSPSPDPVREVFPVSSSASMLPFLPTFNPGVVMGIRDWAVADSTDHGIGLHPEVRAFDRYRASASRGIRLAEFHLDAFDLGEPALFIADESHRQCQVVENHTFFFCVFGFFEPRRQFLLAADDRQCALRLRTSRRAVLAESMATFPPPKTATLPVASWGCHGPETISLHQVAARQILIRRIHTG